jgi:hypothetical protein
MILNELIRQVTTSPFFINHVTNEMKVRIDSCWEMSVKIVPENNPNIVVLRFWFDYGKRGDSRLDFELYASFTRDISNKPVLHHISNLQHPFLNISE